MSKNLDAIKYLNDTCINFFFFFKELYCTITFIRKRAEILRDYIAEVNKALQRLEAIDNANPSEALEKLERIKTQLFEYFESTGVSTNFINDYEELIFEPIKQALLKAQELEKENELLKEIIKRY